MVKKRPAHKQIVNRRARYDYDLDDSLVVGMELTGAETEAIRLGQAHIRGAYVTIKGNELWLINSTIAGGKGLHIEEDQKTRSRKLLAKRKEIEALISSKTQGRTIVPLEILSNGRYIKLRIALGKGKKRYDKRQVLKERDAKRHIETESRYR